MTANRFEATNFLKAFKKAVANGEEITYVGREKNWDALVELGLTTNQRTEIILGLTYTDYSQGPFPDEKGRKGEVWVFGVKHDSTDIYIKLKLVHTRNGDKPVCISFHKAEFKLNYPLKKRR